MVLLELAGIHGQIAIQVGGKVQVFLLLNSGDYLGKAHCGPEYLAVVYRSVHTNVPLNNLALAFKAIKRVIMFLTATCMAVLHQVIAHFVTVYVVFITHFVAPLILLIANLMAMLAARIIAS